MRQQLLAIVCVSVFGCGGDDGGGGAPMATAAITSLNGGGVTGTATFAQDGTNVTVTVLLSGCVDTKAYATHIHTGSACTDNTTQGGHWDMTRGEGIPNIACAGTSGTSTLTRASTDATTMWTVGDASTTDVIGHVIVVHDPDVPMTRIACGPILAAP
jgi:Cu/Zn superoxide dismutase